MRQMVDNQEKIALAAELEGLRSQLKSKEEIAALADNTEREYKALLDDISKKYDKAVAEATVAKDRAMEAAEIAKEHATEIFEKRIEELGANKERLETEAESYYEQLKDRDADIIVRQNQLMDDIAQKQARLAEIEVEEARLREEAELRIRAQEEEAKRQAAATSAQTAAFRPKIKF